MTAPSTEQRIIEGIRAKSVPRRYLLAILKAVADLDGERALEVVDQARLLRSDIPNGSLSLAGPEQDAPAPRRYPRRCHPI